MTTHPTTLETKHEDFEIFLATAPGFEETLCDEVRLKGFKRPKTVPGGVVLRGGWPEVWRANLWIRGASRVLARIETFRVVHLAQLDHLARRVPWAAVLRPDVPFRVEAHCAASRIYHAGAAAERISRAISETLGAPCQPDAALVVRARIERDECTLSIDTSGILLHRRGYKQAVNRAPLRETMAALFLRQCGYDGTEPVVDPMCGSGTFIIEAAEIAARLNPGRGRHFAFEELATFDAQAWERMRGVNSQRVPSVRFYGSDRDAGARAMSIANATRAGVEAYVTFETAPISALMPPEGPKGLVICNPPYGARLGDPRSLVPLYRAFGQVLRERFSGWRAAFVTSAPDLARETGLPFLPMRAPVPHGGLRVSLFQTAPLP